jgi:hypothetical protein
MMSTRDAIDSFFRGAHEHLLKQRCLDAFRNQDAGHACYGNKTHFPGMQRPKAEQAAQVGNAKRQEHRRAVDYLPQRRIGHAQRRHDRARPGAISQNQAEFGFRMGPNLPPIAEWQRHGALRKAALTAGQRAGRVPSGSRARSRRIRPAEHP